MVKRQREEQAWLVIKINKEAVRKIGKQATQLSWHLLLLAGTASGVLSYVLPHQ